jgi:hypothetical protein
MGPTATLELILAHQLLIKQLPLAKMGGVLKI